MAQVLRKEEAAAPPARDAEEEPRGPSEFRLALDSLLRRPPALLSLLVILVVVLWAVLPEFFSPMSPIAQDIELSLKPPGFVDGWGNVHYLGTDEQGRDVLSRIIGGSRISLVVGICAVFVSGLIGVTLGLIAGYFGGTVDAVIGRLIDSLLSVPFILIAMTVVAALGPSLQNIVIAVSVRTWIVYARVIRGSVMSMRENEFVTAARAAGCWTPRILLRHIAPNVVSTAIVIGTLYLGRMIIIEASLSFLGMGVPPPTPTWGGMIADGREFLETAWWLALFPGSALMLTVLSVNLLGDWIRDVLDPQLKRLTA